MRNAFVTLVLALAVTACSSTDPDQPVIPGSGPYGVSGVSSGGGSAAAITGRVCLITADATALGDCAGSGAGGLTVTLGSSAATTANDGTFTMPAPGGTNLAFSVAGPGVVGSTQAFSPSAQIPVMQQDLFDQVLAQNGIVLTAGSGSIFASVLDRGGQPVSGVTATSTPSPAFGPFYDGTAPAPWALDQTGARGVVFLPGLGSTGPTNITFTHAATGSESTVGGVQVVDGGITFVDAVLP